MPKILIIDSVNKSEPWIRHLQSTISQIKIVKPKDLSRDQQLGVTKCEDVDAVFIVISNTIKSGYLKNDCADIKNDIKEGLKSVPVGTPVFIVLAGGSENDLETFKANFTQAEGTKETIRDVEGRKETVHETVSLYQVGKKNPFYVSGIFGFNNSKSVPRFSDVKEVLTPESLEKTRGIQRIKVISKPSTFSLKTTDREEKNTKPKVRQIGNERKEDQAEGTEKKDEQRTKKDEPKKEVKKTSQQEPNKPRPPVITIEQQSQTRVPDPVKKQSQFSRQERKTVATSGSGDSESFKVAVDPPQRLKTKRKLPFLSRIIRPWEITLPTSAMAITVAGLGFLVMLSELIAGAFGASLIMKSGLLASAIAGTTLASLTPVGIVLIGIVVVAFLVGIATFCYCNRENLFGIPQDPLPPSPEDQVEIWQERQNNNALSPDNSFNQVLRQRLVVKNASQPEPPVETKANSEASCFIQ